MPRNRVRRWALRRKTCPSDAPLLDLYHATPTSLAALASAYRTAARDLKHRADARSSSLSSSRPSYLAARPTDLTALEHSMPSYSSAKRFGWTISPLPPPLFGPVGNIAVKNWISLFGLLRTQRTHTLISATTSSLAFVGWLSPQCYVSFYARFGAVANENFPPPLLFFFRSVSGERRPTRGNKKVGRPPNGRPRTLRSSPLPIEIPPFPAQHCHFVPEFYEKVLSSNIPHTEAAAKNTVNPSSWPECTQFAWPLDSISAMPNLVAFGRCAVRSMPPAKDCWGRGSRGVRVRHCRHTMARLCALFMSCLRHLRVQVAAPATATAAITL